MWDANRGDETGAKATRHSFSLRADTYVQPLREIVCVERGHGKSPLAENSIVNGHPSPRRVYLATYPRALLLNTSLQRMPTY